MFSNADQRPPEDADRRVLANAQGRCEITSHDAACCFVPAAQAKEELTVHHHRRREERLKADKAVDHRLVEYAQIRANLTQTVPKSGRGGAELAVTLPDTVTD